MIPPQGTPERLRYNYWYTSPLLCLNTHCQPDFISSWLRCTFSFGDPALTFFQDALLRIQYRHVKRHGPCILSNARKGTLLRKTSLARNTSESTAGYSIPSPPYPPRSSSQILIISYSLRTLIPLGMLHFFPLGYLCMVTFEADG